jgi:hypothetical protein
MSQQRASLPRHFEIKRAFVRSRLSEQVIASAYEHLIPLRRSLLNNTRLGDPSGYPPALMDKEIRRWAATL